MTTAIWYFLIYLAEAFIFSHYCSVVFPAEKPRFGCLFVFYGCLYAASFLQNPVLNTVLFFALNAVYLYFVCTQTLPSAVFHSLIVTLSMVLGELFVLVGISNALVHFYENIENLAFLTLSAIASKFFYFLVLTFFAHRFREGKNRSPISGKSMLLLCLVPLCSVWIAATFFIVRVNAHFTRVVDWIIITSTFCLLFINLLVFGIYEHLLRQSSEFTKLQTQLQSEKDRSEYYRMLAKQDENQKILIHDTRKHLSALLALSEQRDVERISQYLTDLLQSSGLGQNNRICDHELLNAILCRYFAECAEKQIALFPDIQKGSVDFLSDIGLTALFCNLLDNAVAAAAKTPDGFIQLSAQIKQPSGFLVIAMENSCGSNPFLERKSLLIPPTAAPLRYGYGLKSIERIVKGYGGEMQLYYDKEHFSFHTILMLRRQVAGK